MFWSAFAAGKVWFSQEGGFEARRFTTLAIKHHIPKEPKQGRKGKPEATNTCQAICQREEAALVLKRLVFVLKCIRKTQKLKDLQ